MVTLSRERVRSGTVHQIQEHSFRKGNQFRENGEWEMGKWRMGNGKMKSGKLRMRE